MSSENAVVPYEQMQHMATTIAKSGLFGVKTSDQALALMVIAQAEGRHPGTVANEYHIIQGRPSLKADTMLDRYIAAGGTVKWTKFNTKAVAAIFTHPATGSVEVEWTIEMAKDAKLIDKDNWKAFPRSMLRARVISEGVKTSYPGVAKGMYTSEEVADMPLPEPVDVSPGAAGQASASQAIEGEVVGKPATQAPQATGEPGAAKINASQLRVVQGKLNKSGIQENEFLAQFSIGKTEELPFDQLNDALAWLDKHAP